MNSFEPTVTLSQCVDQIVTRDRRAQQTIDSTIDDLYTGLEDQKDGYEDQIDTMHCELDDLATDLKEAEAKLEDQYEDNKYLDDELHSLNTDMNEAARNMEALLADFEVIGMQDIDTYADWAEQAYRAMSKITSGFPIINYVSDFDALEDAEFDIENYDDLDDPYSPANWSDGWRSDTENSFNDNAVETFDATEA